MHNQATRQTPRQQTSLQTGNQSPIHLQTASHEASPPINQSRVQDADNQHFMIKGIRVVVKPN
ncbi:hypothetical protein E2C01_074732 [Portunus trituberculatus]|uniref:Uncharacterized protein n=1 Tax=Portunus trituberculatus TaxID=210409 RepID=A0A5B7ID16_PORTR|nr:hypothetical protein [Portunus trituberculatus]